MFILCVQFIHTSNEEQRQLVPVITTLLKLSPKEKDYVMEITKGEAMACGDVMCKVYQLVQNFSSIENFGESMLKTIWWIKNLFIQQIGYQLPKFSSNNVCAMWY